MENTTQGSVWVYGKKELKCLSRINPNALKSSQLAAISDSFLEILEFLQSNQLSPCLEIDDFAWDGSQLVLGNQHRWFGTQSQDKSLYQIIGGILYQFFTKECSEGTTRAPSECVPKLKKSISDLTMSLLHGTYQPIRDDKTRHEVQPVWTKDLNVPNALQIIEEIGSPGKKGCASLEYLRAWCKDHNVFLFHSWDAKPNPYSLINQIIAEIQSQNLSPSASPPTVAISPWTRQEHIHHQWREYIESLQKPFLEKYDGAVFYFEDIEHAHLTDLDSIRALSFWLRDFPAIMCFRVTHSYSPALRSLKMTMPCKEWASHFLENQSLVWHHLEPEEKRILASASYAYGKRDIKAWAKRWGIPDMDQKVNQLIKWCLLGINGVSNPTRRLIQAQLCESTKQEILAELLASERPDPLELVLLKSQLGICVLEDLNGFINEVINEWDFSRIQHVQASLKESSSWEMIRLIEGQVFRTPSHIQWQKANQAIVKGHWQAAKRLFKSLTKNMGYPPNLRIFFQVHMYILGDLTQDKLCMEQVLCNIKNYSTDQKSLFQSLTSFEANTHPINPFIAAWNQTKGALSQLDPFTPTRFRPDFSFQELPWFREHYQFLSLVDKLSQGKLKDIHDLENGFDHYAQKELWMTFELCKILSATLLGKDPAARMEQLKKVANCQSHDHFRSVIKNLWQVRKKSLGPLENSQFKHAHDELQEIQMVLKTPNKDHVLAWIENLFCKEGLLRCLHVSALLSWIELGVVPLSWVDKLKIQGIMDAHGFCHSQIDFPQDDEDQNPESRFLNTLSKERLIFLPTQKRYEKIMDLARCSIPTQFGVSIQGKVTVLSTNTVLGNSNESSFPPGLSQCEGKWVWSYDSANHAGWSFWVMGLKPDLNLVAIWKVLADFIIDYHAQKCVTSTLDPTPEFGMIGTSLAMQKVRQQIKIWGPSPLHIHIFGQSGTGKELVARALHNISDRPKQLFRAINCSEIPENLMESTLFGHIKGSFTSAHQDRLGLLESLNGGTLFLDEIGDLDPRTQSLLLRVVQEGEFSRVGEHKIRKTNVRLISATHKDLPTMIKNCEFRQDLFYRIAEERITLPTLCQRLEDLPVLCHHFAKKHQKSVTFSGCFFESLRDHHWPGNIRELETYIKRVVIQAGEKREITGDDCVPHLLGSDSGPENESGLPLPILESTFRKKVIQKRLQEFGWNKSQTARSLGISRQRLVFLTKRFGLVTPDPT